MPKSTPKQKKVKTVIAQVPKMPLFDLTCSKPSENEKIVAALQTLETNAGWHFLLQIFQENSRFLESQIISKTDENGQELTEAVVDVLRFKNAYIKELMAKPKAFIEKLTSVKSSANDLDPYERGANQ